MQMEPVNKKFIPRADISKKEMKDMQRQIAREAEFKDRLDLNKKNVEEKIIVGVDQAFTEEKSVSCAVAVKDGKVVEEVSASTDIPMPYIPGLLAFREGGSIVKALEKLEVDPDLLILDGSGRIHFRQAGIATHIGVIFDKPAIGVAKNLLCGKPELNTDELSEGEKVAVRADSKVENLESGVIGYAFQSRQYENSKKINPLYVSPGHRVENETAVELVEKFCEGYKLPEPTRKADKKVSEIKESYS
jgi:deoxyribonuclease V